MCSIVQRFERKRALFRPTVQSAAGQNGRTRKTDQEGLQQLVTAVWNYTIGNRITFEQFDQIDRLRDLMQQPSLEGVFSASGG
jgi:hypothetical protein